MQGYTTIRDNAPSFAFYYDMSIENESELDISFYRTATSYVTMHVEIEIYNVYYAYFHIDDLVVNNVPGVNILYGFSCTYLEGNDNVVMSYYDSTNEEEGIQSESGEAVYSISNYGNGDYWSCLIAIGRGINEDAATNLNTYYYNLGYNEGYSNGLIAGGGSESFFGPFTLLGDAFESMASVMNVQVLGGLTIGGFVAIPLVVTIAITIFRLFRK